MEQLSLREAAARTSVSVTTLRRYIRSGRLRAEKRNGRFGPEYFVAESDLAAAGLETGQTPGLAPLRPVSAPPSESLPGVALDRALRETVPLTLFQELQMKHEQLLVQYGMVRASGLRLLQMQNELEERRRQAEASETRIEALRGRFAREIDDFRRRLRESEMEIEGRELEIAALREKVRGLEMLTRNAVTNETIDRKYAAVMDQIRRIDRLSALAGPRPLRPAPKREDPKPQH